MKDDGNLDIKPLDAKEKYEKSQNEYINTAYDLKKTINEELGKEAFTVFVKIGEAYAGVTQQVGPYAIFVLPGPYADIQIKSADYNQKTGTVSLVFKNNGNAPGYFTYSALIVGEGNVFDTIGSNETLYIEPNAQLGVEHKVNVPKDYEGQVSANITVMYGTSKTVLDNGFNTLLNLATISFEDKSNLTVEKAVFDKGTSTLTLKIRNNGETKAYFKVTVLYFSNEEQVSVEDEVKEIESKKSKVLTYSIPEKEVENMSVNIRYGAREEFMKKEVNANVEVKEESNLIYLAIGVIALGLILYWIGSRKKNKKQKRR